MYVQLFSNYKVWLTTFLQLINKPLKEYTAFYHYDFIRLKPVFIFSIY